MDLKIIGTRIKTLREDCEISIEELAEKCEISVESLKKYEDGDTDISVSILHRISQILGIELTTLLTGEQPHINDFTVTAKGKGVEIKRRSEYEYQSLAYNFIKRKAEPFLVTVQPSRKDCEIKKYSHPGQEFNYILEGTMKLFYKNHEIILNEGDSIYFDSGNDHAMQAIGDKPTKFLAIIF